MGIVSRICLASVFFAVIATACSVQPTKHDTPQPPTRETPIGAIIRRYAVKRSYEECKAKGLNEEQCSKSLESAQQHLESVNARIEALLGDPKTNLCDLVRWAGSCNNPVYTLGDLADCLQVSADRGEALNRGQFTLKLDPHGCPTDNK
jgi:hypothetical protein